MHADLPDLAERAEALDDVGAGLLDDMNVADDDDERQNGDHNNGDPFHKICSSFGFFSSFGCL